VSLRILNASQVRSSLSMAECIDAMRDAMIAVSRGQVAVPPRIIAALPDGSGYFACMPGSSREPPIDGAKVLTLLPGNPAVGRPAIQGVVLLFDHATGAPSVLLDGAELTALRTAAVSGLATRLLARNDARSHGVLGTGVQAGAHIDAVQVARSQVKEVCVWGRDTARTAAFAAQQSKRTGLAVRAVDSAEEASACDIVSACTSATQPVLLGRWLREGAHVNLVGAHRPTHREADTEAIVRGTVFVDLMESALTEAGDLLIPISEGAFTRERIAGDLGSVVRGSIEGRGSQQQITVFKSLGLVAQDLFAGWAASRVARERGVGTEVDF
jgi:ornithine cyclodeaminase/alanine dehydrogenase-like protein (mu-crystallin family)